MPIRLITGPANAGKAELVMAGVRRHLAHGEEPLLVLPTRADCEHYLRELSGRGAALGVRVERFAGLVAEAVRRAEIEGPVLGELARERVIEAIARRHAGGRAASSSARSLAAFFAELQAARVTPARLSAALRAWAAVDGEEACAGELGEIFAAYSRQLADIGRLDLERRAVLALDALRRAPALWNNTPVLLYGFDDLTGLQLDAIETLGSVVDASVTVSLAYEPGRTAFAGRAAAFATLAPLACEHRALAPRAEHYAPAARAPLGHLERSLFEPQAARVQAGGAVRLLEGGGERAELELVAREVRALLGRGMAPEDVAVVVRASHSTEDLIEELFSACGIPYALQRSRRFADTAIGAALLGLLRCVPAERASAGQAAAPAPACGEQGAQADGGALGDLLDWLRAPGLLRPELADGLELAARRGGASGAATARALWRQRHRPLAEIERLSAAQRRGPAALIERAARELQRLFAAPRRRAAAVLAPDELDEARALAAGQRALAELAELAELASALAPASAAELAGALERVRFLSGEPPGAGAVAVLDPLALRARRVRALFLCGLQEGVFPAPARRRPLLSEEERRRLAESSGLRLGEHEDTLAAERYLLYALASRPQELLVLSWHTADDDGQPTSRSLFVEDICDLLDERLAERCLRRPLGAVDMEGGRRTPAPGVRPLREERTLAALRERIWSASSLELWNACPVRWFVERMLRPSALDPEPEPLARGGLAHAALRDTLAGLRRERGSARLTPASLAHARALLGRALEENDAAFPLSSDPERRLAARRRLRADLERYLEHACAADSPLEPRALELAFGFADGGAGERSLPAVKLAGGLTLRGRVDRIDVGDGGEAVLYDYKGRDAPPAAAWLRTGNLQLALYMRAAEQLLGVRAVAGFYQPLSGNDLRARGVLDDQSGVQVGCVRSDRRTTAELRALLDAATGAACRAAAEAARGEIEPRPQTCTQRGRCLYPTICRCER